MVGIKDVARRAGVSVGTVSSVLNRPASVSPELRQRVEAAVAALGYVRQARAHGTLSSGLEDLRSLVRRTSTPTAYTASTSRSPRP